MRASNLHGLKIHIQGTVQGVGFRPFIYNLAHKYQLSGWVKNTSAGVFIAVDGTPHALESFVQEIKTSPPPLAKIDAIRTQSTAPNGFKDFQIIESSAQPGGFVPVPADVAVCDDCLRELFDPANKRFRYPFINCTNCGPRFTIIQDIPYDRPMTTMSAFTMCADCHAEYTNPGNRRFHAQPIACPDCGPHIWLEYPSSTDGQEISTQPLSDDSALQETQRLLSQGKIVAIKGLGGFHLACDALNETAVLELRRRKFRVDKPFAVMMPDLATVEKHCWLNEKEKEALLSKERPILILRRRPTSPIVAAVAPNQDTLGVMLPYTPLHYLLFSPSQEDNSRLGTDVLVMTSGNLSEEPIAFTNQEARQKLAPLADAFLMHQRDIYIRCDDSVGRVIEIDSAGSSNSPRFVFNIIRRARGFTPSPLILPWHSIPLLAAGAELKNTFCLTQDNYAFLSHYIGDMQNYETYQSFEQGIEHFKHIFRVQPALIAHDAHPDYLSTRYAESYAEDQRLPVIRVQHHHAHIASVMAEHGLPSDASVIGVALDGTGYGEDGSIWGGEFLYATYQSYQRLYHLEYFPLPGGDAAIRQPAKIVLAYLWKAGLDWDPDLGCVRHFCADDRIRIQAQLVHQINVTQTSSMGRLFDVVSSLANVRHEVTYEAQAAIELEAIAQDWEGEIYPYAIHAQEILIQPLIRQLYLDVLAGVAPSHLSAKFHQTITQIVLDVVGLISRQTGAKTVALSGGVWQNIRLLRACVQKLEAMGYTVIFHQLIPTNDSGIALGQAAIAHHTYPLL